MAWKWKWKWIWQGRGVQARQVKATKCEKCGQCLAATNLETKIVEICFNSKVVAFDCMQGKCKII